MLGPHRTAYDVRLLAGADADWRAFHFGGAASLWAAVPGHFEAVANNTARHRGDRPNPPPPLPAT